MNDIEKNTLDIQECVENKTSRIYVLRQQLCDLEDKKFSLQRDYKLKNEEEEEARAILAKRLEIADLVYMMKKSKLTDNLAERIGNRIESAETQSLIKCYESEKECISEKLGNVLSSIEQKENEIYKLQREIWELG